MQLCIENVDQAGGCAYGYACVYTDSISWASPTEPLPVIRDPRVAFEKLFGVGATAEERAATPHAPQHPGLGGQRDDVAQDDVRRRRTATASNEYLEDIREVERRIQRIEARNTQRRAARAARSARPACPDSFDEHVQADVRPAGAGVRRRHHARLLVQDGPRRLEPGVPAERRRRPFHPASHHGGNEKGVKEFHQINKYHVACCRTSSTS